MRPDEPVYIVDHLTGAICRPDGPPEVVLEPQPTACMVHLEGDGPIEDYEKNYRIVPVRAWLVAQLPDRVQVDPIIDRPDGRGWIIADFQRVPNRVATESLGTPKSSEMTMTCRCRPRATIPLIPP
jgi:hypothetical protein